jgi:CubicO group peptidase (beta-lactamase class C family)
LNELADAVDRAASETAFSGVVRIDRDGQALATPYGLADRRHVIPNTVHTQFGIASGTKGLTALTIVSLIAQGRLSLETPARSVLGPDLPLIDDEVTVEQLLGHRSGIGDYFDEDVLTDVSEYVLQVPVHLLSDTESYLKVLDGYPAKAAPGERFIYCNSAYVVLALIAERVSGTPFHELMHQRVCAPAGMHSTAFLRSDELPGRAAAGYLDAEGLRTNVFHLPVRGSGDGGVYSTAADIHSLWTAFFGEQIVSKPWLTEMLRPRSSTRSRRYGLGFWLDGSDATVMLEGSDAGVSFRSVHNPDTNVTYTVLSNTSDGAWPIARRLRELLT